MTQPACTERYYDSMTYQFYPCQREEIHRTHQHNTPKFRLQWTTYEDAIIKPNKIVT